MELSQILSYLITILALLTSIFAWIAKLKWSKEFKDAKEAEIKAKIAQIDTIKEELKLYKAIVSEKLFDHAKQTISELENLLSETEESKRNEINIILDKYKESERKLREKYPNNKEFPLLIILSRELRTPITSIMAFNALIKMDSISDDIRKKYDKIIKNDFSRLMLVLDDLLGFLDSIEKISLEEN